jgi:hypothetical protein
METVSRKIWRGWQEYEQLPCKFLINIPPNTACSGRWGFGRIFGDFCAGVEFWRGAFPVRPTAAYANRWAVP